MDTNIFQFGCFLAQRSGIGGSRVEALIGPDGEHRDGAVRLAECGQQRLDTSQQRTIKLHLIAYKPAERAGNLAFGELDGRVSKAAGPGIHRTDGRYLRFSGIACMNHRHQIGQRYTEARNLTRRMMRSHPFLYRPDDSSQFFGFRVGVNGHAAYSGLRSNSR